MARVFVGYKGAILGFSDNDKLIRFLKNITNPSEAQIFRFHWSDASKRFYVEELNGKGALEDYEELGYDFTIV